MQDAIVNPYDAVAYPGHAFSQTHPARLATIAHFHGMDPAPTATMRVLELGCGRGGNLIPMAFHHPEARFVGIDLSLSAIEHARISAAELGLANLVFHHLDILDVTPELGRFDYIIVHGVYSWVPEPVRDGVMAIFQELLSPQGVAYVSYNALPGCRLRDLARDVMLFETRDIADPQERVRVARASLKAFAEASDPNSFYGSALRLRLEQIADTPDNVLYHDDLNPGARAFALHEVLGAAGRHGLQFLSEASFSNRYSGVRGSARELLAQIPIENAVLREQSLDLLIGRSFRETLLCRAGIALRRGMPPGVLRQYHLAAHASVVEQKEEEKRPGVDRFSFGEGVGVSVDLPLCKTALRILGGIWPASITWDELAERALRDVGEGVGSDTEHELVRLEEALTAIFKAGLLDITLEKLPLTTEISEKPVANGIARWQALTTGEVTDLRHRMVLLEGLIVRKFVSLLDGSRTPEMLLADLNAFLAEAHASGADVTGLPARATAEEIEMHLRDVATLGLLHG